MTFKQVLREKYGNGKRTESAVRILEVVIGAGIIGLGGIAYQGWLIAPKLAQKMEVENIKVMHEIKEIQREQNNIKERQFWVLEDLVCLRDALENHMKKPAPRPNKVRP